MRYYNLIVVVALFSFVSAAFAAPQEKTISVQSAIEQLKDFNMQYSPSGRSDGKPDPRTIKRDQIVKALRADHKKSVPALAKALKDPNVLLRRNASLLLGEFAGVFGDAKEDISLAVPALADAVNDSDFNVRVWSMGALKALGPAAESALPALETALKDKDKAVRVNAKAAIKSIKVEK